MTCTEALIKAIEIHPAIVGIQEAGVIDISGYAKEIQMRQAAFLNLFSEYNVVDHDETYNKLFVDVNGYKVFTLEPKENADDC